MQGKGNCGIALREFTLLLSMFLIRFFVIDAGLNPCDLLKALSKGWFCLFLFPFSSSLSRSHQQARQGGCPEWGLHPPLCAVYFYRNYTADPTLGTQSHLELGSPNFILLQWKVFIDFHLMLFLKLHFSISEICPCGCSLGFQKWRYGSWSGFRINNETCVQSLQLFLLLNHILDNPPMVSVICVNRFSSFSFQGLFFHSSCLND